MAKRLTQRECIAFIEIYFPVVKHTSIGGNVSLVVKENTLMDNIYKET